MKVINSNPYRILGIKANASAPEKQRAKTRIEAYVAVGKAPVLEFDLTPPLKPIERTQDLIDLKSNEILSDEDKVKNAIFWFVSGGTIDDIALANLTESKDIEKALANFEKGSKGFVIDTHSISSIINHSTLEIICYAQHKNKTRLKKAISLKLDIACSEQHLSLLLNLLNPNNSTISPEAIKPHVISSIKEFLSDFFKSQNEDDLFLEFFASQQEMIAEFKHDKIEKLIRRIKSLAEDTKKKRKILLDDYKNSFGIGSKIIRNGGYIGRTLIQNSKELLYTIKNENGKDHPSTTMVYEIVMKELNYCGVLPYNAIVDKINNASGEKYNLIFNSLSESDFDTMISMTENAIELFGDVDTTVLITMRNNNNGYVDFKNQLKRRKSSGSELGGCLGDILGGILEFFGGWIIVIFIIVVLSLFGGC